MYIMGYKQSSAASIYTSIPEHSVHVPNAHTLRALKSFVGWVRVLTIFKHPKILDFCFCLQTEKSFVWDTEVGEQLGRGRGVGYGRGEKGVMCEEGRRE